MFEKLFKGMKHKQKALQTIDSETAASFVVRANIDDLKEEWDLMKSEIYNYNEAFINSNESWVKYEIMLAALVADTLALYNLFPKDDADSLFHSLLTFLGNMDDIGEISVEAVKEYYNRAQQAVNENENPLEFVASAICVRLEVPEEEIGPFTMTGLMHSVALVIGKWKWIQQSFNVSISQ